MSETVMEHIFEPYFTTARESGGSGLGMSIVYNLVSDLFNGTISCTSVLGKGTHFIIKWPIEEIET